VGVASLRHFYLIGLFKINPPEADLKYSFANRHYSFVILRETHMILAQLSVYPIGEGTSLSRFVKEGVKVIKESGYTYEIG
jgi:hypothetical protein